MKPKVEGEARNGVHSAGVGGGGADAVSNVEEPDPKRVKAEPQEEEERGALGSGLAVDASAQQPPVAPPDEAEQPPRDAAVADGLNDPTPFTSASSSLFLPE